MASPSSLSLSLSAEMQRLKQENLDLKNDVEALCAAASIQQNATSLSLAGGSLGPAQHSKALLGAQEQAILTRRELADVRDELASVDNARRALAEKLRESAAKETKLEEEAAHWKAQLARALSGRDASDAALANAVADAATERGRADRLQATVETREEEVRHARADAEAAREEARLSRADAEAAREEARLSRTDAEAAREEASTSRADAEAAREEASTSRADAEAAREEASVAHDEAQAAREEARAAREETRAAREEIQAAREEAEEAARGEPPATVASDGTSDQFTIEAREAASRATESKVEALLLLSQEEERHLREVEELRGLVRHLETQLKTAGTGTGKTEMTRHEQRAAAASAHARIESLKSLVSSCQPIRRRLSEDLMAGDEGSLARIEQARSQIDDLLAAAGALGEAADVERDIIATLSLAGEFAARLKTFSSV